MSAPASPPSGRSSLQVPRSPDAPPPPYSAGEALGAGSVYSPWAGVVNGIDPRSSSTQSLAPSIGDPETETRRTLLIIYIHGFMGNDSSFRSFPAHVHGFLKASLADSHVIHTKVYPRYKTYKAIEVARDNVSAWLEPHESETTDVILIGHSMGGLLAAEVVLMPSPNPQASHPFKHRILGTLSLDSPFLGLHPGIIVSGIASLFRKSPELPKDDEQFDLQSLNISTGAVGSLSPDPSVSSGFLSPLEPTSSYAASGASSSISGAQTTPDPLFNPPFFNDVLFKDRGWWKNIAHFAKKHKPEGIVSATRTHLINHLEFGACLMDLVGLNQRYDKLRRLEDVDDFDMSSGQGGRPGPRKDARVRFVNYFTLSTGRAKSPSKASGRSSPASRRGSGVHLRPEAASAPASSRTSTDGDSRASTPRISIEDHSDSSRVETLETISPEPLPASYRGSYDAEPIAEDSQQDLADIPELPGEEDKETRAASLEAGPDTSPSALTEERGGSSPDPNQNEHRQESVSQAPSLPHQPNSSFSLPPVPDLPEPPQPPDLDSYPDKEARKQAEREGKRAQKAYEQAMKNRDRAIKERQKLVEKQQKKAKKEAERLAKQDERKRRESEAAQQKEQQALQREEEGQRQTEEAQRRSRQEEEAALQKKKEEQALRSEADELERRLEGRQQTEAPAKKKKERKFCTLPRKVNGARDPAWVEVYMEGVDEVGAHCGLFFGGSQYEGLIGDVGSRIVSWVHEDASKRAILALD